MTYKITIPVANQIQARAYIERIEGSILLWKEVQAENEGAFWTSHGTEITIFVSDPARLVAVATELHDEEYI
jgi:hypothetical protein